MPSGRVVAAHGRHFHVEYPEGVVECVMRGKKGGIACGDRVAFQFTHLGRRRHRDGGGSGQPALPLRRDAQQAHRRQPGPGGGGHRGGAVFREELLIRCLVACETADIPVLILLNKTDLPETAALADHLAVYAALGLRLPGGVGPGRSFGPGSPAAR
jgi:ribosome biogenesis GTPase